MIYKKIYTMASPGDRIDKYINAALFQSINNGCDVVCEHDGVFFQVQATMTIGEAGEAYDSARMKSVQKGAYQTSGNLGD